MNINPNKTALHDIIHPTSEKNRRLVQHPQRHFGQVDIAEIENDPRTRDDIPAHLKGLQQLYIHAELRQNVFAILEQTLGEDVHCEVGRPGRELWKILVLGTLKPGTN